MSRRSLNRHGGDKGMSTYSFRFLAVYIMGQINVKLEMVGGVVVVVGCKFKHSILTQTKLDKARFRTPPIPLI